MKTVAASHKPEKNYWIFFLSLILLLRISSYFMISEDAAVTQLFKTGIRLILTFITGVCFLYHRKNVLPIKNVNWLPVLFYAAYLSLGAASLSWSTSLQASLLQILMDVETFVFVFFYMQVVYAVSRPSDSYRNSPKDVVHQVLAGSIFFTGVVFACGLYFNPDAFYRLTHGGEVSRLGGFIINPNELGMLLVLGVTAFLFDFFREGKLRIRNLLAIAFLSWLLLLTGSRSSFIAFMLVIGVYAITRPSYAIRIGLLTVGLIFALFTGYKVFVKMGDTSEVMSMTGRIPFWTDLLHYNFPKEPWLGFGYMRIDYGDKFESLNAYAGAMTHNTFLQVLLGLGVAGLFLVIVQLCLFFQAVLQNKNVVIKRYIFLSFIPLFVNSLTEFGIFGETNYGILFYLMLNFYAIHEPRFENHRIKRHVKTNTGGTGVPFGSGDAAQASAA